MGEEVLLSHQLLETISVEAQIWLYLDKAPIEGNFLFDMTFRAVQDALGNAHTWRGPDIMPFFAGLNRVMYNTFCCLAERAGLARRERRRLVTEPAFWEEFRAASLHVKPRKKIAKLRKSLFKVCHEVVRKRYMDNDPDNGRHTDLIALCMFNYWNATGLLPMTRTVVISGSPNESGGE